MVRIRWKRSEEGHVDSHCGRFMIEALYMGTTRPQGYQLVIKDGPKPWSADTQKVLKAEAQEWLDKQTP